MEWTAIGVAVAGVAYGVWQFYQTRRAKNVNDKKVEEVAAAVQHNEADQTAKDIIQYYKEKIEILEARLTTLEEAVLKQNHIIEQQKTYIESLIKIVTGRDPAIQEFLKLSGVTIEKFNKHTAPKVDAIHDHLIPKKAV